MCVPSSSESAPKKSSSSFRFVYHVVCAGLILGAVGGYLATELRRTVQEMQHLVDSLNALKWNLLQESGDSGSCFASADGRRWIIQESAGGSSGDQCTPFEAKPADIPVVNVNQNGGGDEYNDEDDGEDEEGDDDDDDDDDDGEYNHQKDATAQQLNDDKKTTVSDTQATPRIKREQPPPLYECPQSPPPKAKNDIGGEYFGDHMQNYLKDHKPGEETNREYYINGFRDAKHGGHWETYDVFKEKVYDFRAKVFGDNLQDGDLIYEGAGAEGFNLLTTLEILHEERGISNLTVYGNDYVGHNVEVANKLFDAQVSVHDWLNKGSYCQGDSTNLSFVPSNSFDLAYTYVDPLIDGLGMYADSDIIVDDMSEELSELCDSDDEEDQEIIRKDQALQEEWHAAWVKELVRIVKPGKLIVIESVCQPLCHPDSDWGGVSDRWWFDAHSHYEWDVDPDSIEIIKRTWYGDAYHVLMRKKMNQVETQDGDGHV